jgi:phenylalanine-4-hydroxylase
MASAQDAPSEAAFDPDRYAPRLPQHLKRFVVDQRYDRYSPIDHAVWRYIMRQNVAFLKDHAHPAYLEGLRKTGIFVDRIPKIEEMNEILGRIGWAAVTVDGFIPPAAFMEFQAHRVLVIAADMRQIDHIEYTPAPDIVHEAAGHAPIIADATYAEYLRRIGEVGAKAMSSKKDFELYEAIRHLSILKETPGADTGDIAAAEREVEERQSDLGEPSEMARLSRLHWWTVEYGLIGSLDEPRIYGAGLLSSIGESVKCLRADVRKLPYSLDAADMAFDITTMQPQLFVTPSFEHLLEVLEAFAADTAFRVGGTAGLAKAIECENVATAVLSSGLQITGVFAATSGGDDDQPAYVRTSGPSALSVADRELRGHGRSHHADGFGSPVGRLEGATQALETMSDGDLAERGLVVGQPSTLVFASGVTVRGRLDELVHREGLLILMRFSDCTVSRGGETLFRPEWGTYDMAVGDRVVSVFSGAADKDAFDQASLVPKERTVQVAAGEERLALQRLYAHVRAVRDGRATVDSLDRVARSLQAEFPADWLASLEILEILNSRADVPELRAEVCAHLDERAADPALTKLVANGLSLIAS